MARAALSYNREQHGFGNTHELRSIPPLFLPIANVLRFTRRERLDIQQLRLLWVGSRLSLNGQKRSLPRRRETRFAMYCAPLSYQLRGVDNIPHFRQLLDVGRIRTRRIVFSRRNGDDDGSSNSLYVGPSSRSDDNCPRVLDGPHGTLVLAKRRRILGNDAHFHRSIRWSGVSI